MKEKLGIMIIFICCNENISILVVIVEFYFYRIQIDYESLTENLRDLDEPDEIKKMTDRLEKSIFSLQQTVDKIQAPNMRVLTYSINFVNLSLYLYPVALIVIFLI